MLDRTSRLIVEHPAEDLKRSFGGKGNLVVYVGGWGWRSER